MEKDCHMPAGRAYLFDMDGTIVDNCGYHVKSWLAFANRHGKVLTETQILDWMGAANRVYCERLFGHPISDEENARYTSEKETIYREIYRPHLRAPEGLRELLASARRGGIRCAVVTGGSKPNVDFILDGLALRGEFSLLVDDSCYTRSKPDPECFLVAAEKFGVDPADCTVFEDAVAGVRSAKAAGMRVIAITHTNPRETLLAAGADRVIDAFTELL